MKPMLLSNDEYDLTALDFTDMYISSKLDGIRAVITKEGIKNRSLKVLRNEKVQEYFKDLCDSVPDGWTIEGEIYAESTPCRTMAGICNSSDHDVPEDMMIFLFGVVEDIPFSDRFKVLTALSQDTLKGKFHLIQQTKVSSHQEATDMYEHFLEQGCEGAVLMDGRKTYKHGRVTIKESIGFKMKPHREDDLLILGINERFKNLNEKETNELGDSFRRDTVDAKESTGIAATFDCELLGTTTKVSLTGDLAYRKYIWEHQDEFIGKYAVVKSLDYGTKDKLRHPILVKIKEKIEK